MKTLTFLSLLISSSILNALEPPRFLSGFNYRIDTAETLEGEEFEIYVIDDSEYNAFKKSILKYRKKGFDIERNGLLWVYRNVDGYEVYSARGFGFKQFIIFQE